MAKIAYATKVENGGTTTAGQARAVDMNEIKTSVNVLYDQTPYTSYVARLTQSGTGNVTLVVLQNTTGLTFTPTRTGVGTYFLTPNTPPSIAKTALFGGDRVIEPYYDGSVIKRIFSTEVSGSPADSALNGQSIEFRIYP